jgi:putative PIN family toxin of toxin-antitoxin system
MQAVLDANVIISALLSPQGSPAQVLRAWLDGSFELVVSPRLLAELERALAYPKVRRRISAGEAAEMVDLLRRSAHHADDPSEPPKVRSPDPGDDYLIALAAGSRAVLVSGDGHLVGLADQIPVFSPVSFLALVATGR